jgi:hypothetical protein
MKVIVNGVSTDPCFKCDGKDHTRSVVVPNRFTGTLCMKCVTLQTNEPVQKIVRKPSQKKEAK